MKPTKTPGTGSKPASSSPSNPPATLLQGVRVLDLSWHGPGHIATWLLAELGADVIVVEAPDDTNFGRVFPPLVDGESFLNLTFGRRKRSLAIDVRDPRGLGALKRVAATADAAVVGYRTGVAERLGLGAGDLQAVNPRLTYCSVSGFGSGGPLEGAPGHDLNYIALAGVFAMARDAPSPLPTQVADHLGAVLAATAVLSGVVNARRTGLGAVVETSLFDAARFSALLPAAQHLMAGMQPGPRTLPTSGTFAFYDVYECADGALLTVAAVEPPFWRRFCELTELDDLIDAQYAPERQHEIRKRVAEVLASRAREEWHVTFEGQDVCVAPVLTVEEALEHPQVRAQDGIATVRHPHGQRLGAPPSPIRVDGASRSSPGNVAALGADTTEILREAGLDDGDIGELAADGVTLQSGAPKSPEEKESPKA